MADDVKTEIDFDDPKVKALIDERVAEATASEKKEYGEALEAYQAEARYTTSPGYQQLKVAIDSGKDVHVSAGAPPAAPPVGGPPAGASAFDRWAQGMGKRMATNIKDPATASFLTDELTNLAANLIQSGVGSAKGAETAVRKDVDALKTQIEGQDAKSIVQNLYFLDTEIMPGVKMSQLQSLGISPSEVAQKLGEFRPGHEKTVISAMIANKQNEVIGKLIQEDQKKSENLEGMGVPGPTRTLKLELPDHTFGDRPSLDKISQGLGKQLGATPEEVEARFSQVR